MISLQPGEVIVARELLPPELARHIGSSLLSDMQRLGPLASYGRQNWIYGAPALSNGNLVLTDALAPLALAEQAMRAVRPQEELGISSLAATYMSDEIARYEWHVDTRPDIRAVINVSPVPAEALVANSHPRLSNAAAGILLDVPPTERITKLILDPGDAYFLNNQTPIDLRTPHSTTPGSKGRIALRYTFEYPGFQDITLNLPSHSEKIISQPSLEDVLASLGREPLPA